MIQEFKKIWFRFFFKRELKLFSGCLLLLFLLFVLTDLMGHVQELVDHHSNVSMWTEYYISLLSIRFDTLVPFSLLISTTLLLTSISKKNEMIPLLNGGLSISRQIRPFFMVAFIAMFLMWSNAQWFYPSAVKSYDYIKETDFGKEKLSTADLQKMGTIYLQDGSKLFFQKSDPAKQKLYDVFWISNSGTILHIEELSYVDNQPPEGILVDIIERSPSNIATKTKSYQKTTLNEIQLSQKDVDMATLPPKHLSITELFAMTIRTFHSSGEKANDIFIMLMLKLLSPLTCLLAIIVPIPYCLSFQREKHPVLFLFFFLAGLFIFHLTVQTCTILARIPNFPSLFFLVLPWAVAGYFSIKRLHQFLHQV